jgi:hypothetical protein
VGLVINNQDASLDIPRNAESGLYLFEAINKKDIKRVVCVDLIERLKTHKGQLYYKPLEKRLDAQQIEKFDEFIRFCCNNMYYETRIINNSIYNYMFNVPINLGVNCGELVFLSLIRLGLLPIEMYKQAIKLHYLKYVSYLTKLENNKFCEISRIYI